MADLVVAFLMACAAAFAWRRYVDVRETFRVQGVVRWRTIRFEGDDAKTGFRIVGMFLLGTSMICTVIALALIIRAVLEL